MKKMILVLFFLIANLDVKEALLLTAKGEEAKITEQYAFIMLESKDFKKIYFSPIFSFKVNKKGDPICDIRSKELEYRDKVADKQWHPACSDYFDSREDAMRFREIDIKADKDAGRTVMEPKVPVGDCM